MNENCTIPGPFLLSTSGASRRKHRQWFATASIIWCMAHSSDALAESSAAEKAQAEFLFRDGKKLLSEGRYGEACPKLAESYRIEPVPGTLLNVAVCHEKEGKTASAWAEFSQSVELATRDHRDDR